MPSKGIYIFDSLARIWHRIQRQASALIHFGLQGGGCSFCQFSKNGGARYDGNCQNGSGLRPTKIVGIGTWLNCSLGAYSPINPPVFSFISASKNSGISSFDAYTVTPVNEAGTFHSVQSHLLGPFELSNKIIGAAPDCLIASEIAFANPIASGSANLATVISLKWPRSASAISFTWVFVRSLGFNWSSIANRAASLFSARPSASAASFSTLAALISASAAVCCASAILLPSISWSLSPNTYTPESARSSTNTDAITNTFAKKYKVVFFQDLLSEYSPINPTTRTSADTGKINSEAPNHQVASGPRIDDAEYNFMTNKIVAKVSAAVIVTIALCLFITVLRWAAGAPGKDNKS